MGNVTIRNGLPEDMTLEEKQSLSNYIENGIPGMISDSARIFQCFQLYMSGKTYSEISEASGIKKDIILYFSNKFKWFDKKMNHYSDLMENMAKKVSHARLESANTIVTVVSALSKHRIERFAKYSANRNDNIIQSADMKL